MCSLKYLSTAGQSCQTLTGCSWIHLQTEDCSPQVNVANTIFQRVTKSKRFPWRGVPEKAPLENPSDACAAFITELYYCNAYELHANSVCARYLGKKFK